MIGTFGFPLARNQCQNKRIFKLFYSPNQRQNFFGENASLRQKSNFGIDSTVRQPFGKHERPGLASILLLGMTVHAPPNFDQKLISPRNAFYRIARFAPKIFYIFMVQNSVNHAFDIMKGGQTLNYLFSIEDLFRLFFFKALH